MVIAFEAGVKYKGKIYFSAMNMNGLFSFDPLTKETELISVFEKEKIKNWLHLQAFLYEDTMWLVPYQAKHIACVNLETKAIEYYDDPASKEMIEENPYHGGIAVGNELYLIPYKAKTFPKIDMLCKEVSEISHTNAELRDTIRAIYIYDEKIGVIDNDGEIQTEISLNNGNLTKRKKVLGGNGGYLSAIQREDGVLMIPYDANKVRKVSFSGKEVDMKLLPDSSDLFYRGVNIGKYVVLYPGGTCRKLAVIEWDTLEIKIIDRKLTDDGKCVMAPNGWFEMQTIPADEGWWASSTDGFLLEFTENGEVQSRCHVEADSYKLKEEISLAYKNFGMQMEFGDKVVAENDIFGLDNLIQFLTDSEVRKMRETK